MRFEVSNDIVRTIKYIKQEVIILAGKILGYQVVGNKVIFDYQEMQGIIEVITPSIINVYVPLMREQQVSRAIEKKTKQEINLEVKEVDDSVTIQTPGIVVKVNAGFKVDFFNCNGEIICKDYRGQRESFIRKGKKDLMALEGHSVINEAEKQKIQVLKEIIGNEYYYGLGEETGHLNKKGYYYQMWNTDEPNPHVESFEKLYKSIPFLITLREGIAYGLFFDNTFKASFDLGKENSKYLYYGAEDGNLDYYFLYGPTIKEVVKGYSYLTGTTPLPQLWTLGYQQSRHSYDHRAMVEGIATKFREKKIPCDVIYLDIEYMDGYRVFTWDEQKFPGFAEMIKELKEMGYKVVTIIDPGIKKDRGYRIYDQGLAQGYFATDRDGITYVNEVWPGKSVYPDFSEQSVRKWWGRNHQELLEAGVAGIWNDMNEPASFAGPLPDDVQFKNDGFPSDHREIHNVYGHLMSKATYQGLKEQTGKRPFVITRACYAGTQKYSTVWTGDNQSIWEHLRMSLPMLMNLGLSGISFCGTDVGGFGFDCSAELLSRWIQVGSFAPLFRNHSNMYTRDQEPWAFDEQTEEICRKYINLRYRLIPYLYDLMWKGEKTGLPVIRPLLMEYQDDQNTYQINDQFMFGEKIMVAPVLEQGKTFRALYLPAGKWFDYWSGEIIEGGKRIVRDAPLDVCPLYIKAGSIIPNYQSQNYLGERVNKELILDLYPGTDSYTHYQDDGESFNYQNGQYNIYTFKQTERQNTITVEIEKPYTGYSENYSSFLLKVNHYQIKSVSIDEQVLDCRELNHDSILRLDPSVEKVVITR